MFSKIAIFCTYWKIKIIYFNEFSFYFAFILNFFLSFLVDLSGGMPNHHFEQNLFKSLRNSVSLNFIKAALVSIYIASIFIVGYLLIFFDFLIFDLLSFYYCCFFDFLVDWFILEFFLTKYLKPVNILEVNMNINLRHELFPDYNSNRGKYERKQISPNHS